MHLKKRRYLMPFLAIMLVGAACGPAPADLWHTNITTTYVQGGTEAGEWDSNISNVPSAWYDDWGKHLCGPDFEGARQLVKPGCDNLYYFALPCDDYDESGNLLTGHIRKSPWPIPAEGQSAFKNKWIRVVANGRSVYLQWEDVGPTGEDERPDCDYVFGYNAPRYLSTGATYSGLDISPLAFKYLTGRKTLAQIEDLGEIKASWRFIPESQVPDGPWKKNITTSGPDWAA